MRIFATAAFASAFALCAPALAADGHGHDHGHDHAGAHAGHDMSHMDDLPRFGRPGDADQASRTVTITATEIAFDLPRIEAKKGETIVFVLVNHGTQTHELGVGDEAFLASHRKMKADMPGHEMASPNRVVARPGETTRFAWTFTQAGAFAFACSFPGHTELGMHGEIVVK